MGDLPDLANLTYLNRVNRAIDYVTRNLAEPLKLDDVARVACFSPYHFHRIFRMMVGETLLEFVKRVRLERALYLLSHRENTSLTEIALACGFNSSSDFSRCFKARYGVSPRNFDLETHREQRRSELVSVVPNKPYLEKLPEGNNPDGFVVKLRQLPPRRVAYIRVFRPYEGTGVLDAFQRLLQWAKDRNLEKSQWLGYQWDDPEIVPLAQCRYDLGLEIPESIVLDERVSQVKFPAMLVAEIDIAGSLDLELRALQWLYGTWLPDSGYAPDHQPCFEAWNGLPFSHGDSHFELRVHLPVVDAALKL